MKCHGKCYLKKQLKQAGTNTGTGSEGSRKMEIDILVFLLPHPLRKVFSHAFSVPSLYNLWRSAFVSRLFIADIFHPPPDN